MEGWGAGWPLGTSGKQRENRERVTPRHQVIPKPRSPSSVACVLFLCFDAALTDPPEHTALGSGRCRKPCPAVGAALLVLCLPCSPLPGFRASSCLYKRGSPLAESSKLSYTWAKHAAHQKSKILPKDKLGNGAEFSSAPFHGMLGLCTPRVCLCEHIHEYTQVITHLCLITPTVSQGKKIALGIFATSNYMGKLVWKSRVFCTGMQLSKQVMQSDGMCCWGLSPCSAAE